MARGIAIAIALLLAGAAPAERTVPHLGGGPALVIPAGSPVKFRGFDKDGGARFSGRFVLSGTFVYHCEVECEPGMTEADLDLGIVPDPGLAARLPHWKDRGETPVDYSQGGENQHQTLTISEELTLLILYAELTMIFCAAKSPCEMANSEDSRASWTA